ncbi:INO80 complex subunit B isoform X2 [Copidosoma floridanum]|uniref:INO80 complex subunit B isoform X2 n=1 Tax=Copidosoma floridanum TaxID=29053 RepID=UPI0006C961F1|nr:INO80 complex subunit B isoform X2 [Copidosoma floridanum]
MGKTKEVSSEEEINIVDNFVSSIPQKRHKKHKHKKHKRKKSTHDEESYIDISGDTDLRKTFKVRLKKEEDRSLDKTKEKVFKIANPTLPSTSNSLSPKASIKKKVIKTNKGKDSGTSSEEERWLDAIESGKLEEVDDELKKIKPKDPKLMTARQRAMFERKSDTEPNAGMEQQLMSLPTGYKEKVMTAEAIQKAALKSLKRKQLADEKREKDKKKTMERLLKKQETKSSKIVTKSKTSSKRQVPLIMYKITLEGSTISLPIGERFPLQAAKAKDPPKPVLCGNPTCSNLKRYCCAKTGIPLCSLLYFCR